MAERKAVNKYYPPEWTPAKGSINKFRGTHALRERARKLHLGILIIRFEMPFNIWCNGCGNHIGMGVRYNAEKTKTGMYYTTPIYKFRMKCHLCTNHFEIQTDPQEKKKDLASAEERDSILLQKSSLNLTLLPENAEDRKLAGLLKLAPLISFEEKRKITREATLSRPLFPSAENSPISSVAKESKMKILMKPLTKTDLGIMTKTSKIISNENGNTSSNDSPEKRETNVVTKTISTDLGITKGTSEILVGKKINNKKKELKKHRTSLVAFDYDSSDSSNDC